MFVAVLKMDCEGQMTLCREILERQTDQEKVITIIQVKEGG